MGGVIYELDHTACSTFLRLQAYVDANGKIKAADGHGYKITQLQSMLNLDYRPLKRALTILKQKGIINEDMMGVITIKDYRYNNDMRFKYNNPYPAQTTRESLGIPEGGKND
jgi:hypothetical protein